MLERLPLAVTEVIREFRVCEFSSLARDGTPITWPVSTRFHEETNRFVLTTSIGLPSKAFRIRRNPRVSLLFSDSTASGLVNPPAVLVQGDAVAPEEIITSMDGVEGLREYWRDAIFRRQPATAAISNNFIMRKLMDWYYMRIVIQVAPRRVSWWPDGDFSNPPQSVDLDELKGEPRDVG